MVIVIMWIAEGNKVRKQRHQAILDAFCAKHPVHKLDWNLLKRRFMSLVAAIPSITIEDNLLAHCKAISSGNFSFTKKLVLKSTLQHVVESDNWTYSVAPLHELYSEIPPQFAVFFNN